MLPATLGVTYVDGSKQDVRIPWATWQQHRSYVVHVNGTQKIATATIDPTHALPDSDRNNNSVTMP